MRKLWLLTALLFVLAGCSDQPQPAVSPIPMAAPSIANVSMLAGDDLGVTCDGLATLAGDSPNYTLSCAALIVVDTPTATETLQRSLQLRNGYGYGYARQKRLPVPPRLQPRTRRLLR
jgi:hypothetical protein